MIYDGKPPKDTDLKSIYNSILGTIKPTGKNKIKVFSIDAGRGKTTTMINALIALYKKNPNVKSLLVINRNIEGMNVAEKINLALQKNDIAFAFNLDTKEQVKNIDLTKYPILIITHTRYKLFSRTLSGQQKKKYEHQIQQFTQNRTNLIIDEELDVSEDSVFNQKTIMQLDDILRPLTDSSLYIEFREIVKKIETLLVESKSQTGAIYPIRCLAYYCGYTNMEDYFLSFIDKVDSHKFPRKYFDNTSFFDKYDFIETLKQIYVIYWGDIIIGRGSIYVLGKQAEYFCLENNIVLDATASMNSFYRLNKIFKIVPTKYHTDYGKWKLHFYPDNTSKNKFTNNPSAYKKIFDFVFENVSTNDKALVITTKEGKDRLESYFSRNSNIDITYSQVMRGLNDWRDFNKCFFVHTPLLPSIHYPVKYMAHTGQTINNNDLIFQALKNSLKFNHSELTNLLVDDIVCTMYQGIKRINRDNSKVAEVYIFCKLKSITYGLKRNFAGATFVDHPPYIFEKKQAQSKYTVLFINIMDKAIKGGVTSLQKKDVIAQLGCHPKRFSSTVLKNSTVQQFLNKKKITISHQKIIFPLCALPSEP